MRVDNRGVSATLGIVLLFAIVIAGMVAVVTMGATALDDTQEQLDTSRAEKALTQFDSKSAMVALGGTSNQGSALVGDQYYVRDDAGWMNVTIENTTTGDTTTLLNKTMGKVMYENENTSLAYQGGGVWRGSNGGASMLSPPEFHFRNATLTLPIIAVDGQAGLSGATSVEKNGSAKKYYPNSSLDSDFTNPLTDGKVNVTVNSDYYEAWGRYFEQRTEGEVYYDHENETATITLVVPAGGRTVNSAVASTSKGRLLKLSGSGSSTLRVDSYTSSDGDGYSGDNHDGGTISAGGSIEITGNSCINGDVRSGKKVRIQGSSSACSAEKVKGDVQYTTSYLGGPSSYGGELKQIDGLDRDGKINNLVDDRVEQARDSSNVNNNGDVSARSLNFGSDDTAELGAGKYYLNMLEVPSGETVDIDTSGGDVIIGIEDGIRLRDSASIDVTGPNQVKIYVKGEGVGNEMILEKSSSITVPNQDSTQLWLYGKSDFYANMKGAGNAASGKFVEFQGVIYAPGGTSGSGMIKVKKTEIFGGLVGPKVEIGNGGTFHYDRALANERAIEADQKVVAVTYLHVTVNQVNITSK